MNKDKSIYACLEEVKQREVCELKQKLTMCDERKFRFDSKGPYVTINDGTPHDIRITEAGLDDECCLHILAYDEDAGQYIDVDLDDIIYGHIEFITDSIPVRSFSQDSFSISRLSREDLEQQGFDTSDVDDKMMQRLADKLGDDYCEQLFWVSLDIIAESMGIPKKKRSKKSKK